LIISLALEYSPSWDGHFGFLSRIRPATHGCSGYEISAFEGNLQVRGNPQPGCQICAILSYFAKILTSETSAPNGKIVVARLPQAFGERFGLLGRKMAFIPQHAGEAWSEIS
jgi:hypothetical protein